MEAREIDFQRHLKDLDLSLGTIQLKAIAAMLAKDQIQTSFSDSDCLSMYMGKSTLVSNSVVDVVRRSENNILSSPGKSNSDISVLASVRGPSTSKELS